VTENLTVVHEGFEAHHFKVVEQREYGRDRDIEHSFEVHFDTNNKRIAWISWNDGDREITAYSRTLEALLKLINQLQKEGWKL